MTEERTAGYPSTPVIHVDDREQAPQLLNALERVHGIEVVVRRLERGDYVVPPDTVIERKTVEDFCASLVSGRLFRQAYRLVEDTETPILIIEGRMEDHGGPAVSRNAVRGALITLAQTFRLPVLRTCDQTDTAWHLAALLRQRRRLASRRGVLLGYLPRSEDARKLRLLQTIPGIGPKRARLLLEQFGTVAHIAAAAPDELAAVPGIGRRHAERIHTILHESSGLYC